MQSVVLQINELRTIQERIERLAHTSDAFPAQKLLLEQASPISKNISILSTQIIDLESELEATPERKVLFKSMADIRGNFSIGVANIRLFLLSGNQEHIVTFEKHWETLNKNVLKLQTSSNLLSTSQLIAFQSLTTELEKFKTLPYRIFELRTDDKYNLANFHLEREAIPLAMSIFSTLETLTTNHQQILAESFAKHDDHIQNIVTRSKVFSAITLAVIILIGLLGVQKLRRLINNTNTVINQIGNGKWDGGKALEGSIAMTLLGDSFHKLQQKIDQRTRTIEEKADTVRAVVNTSKDSILSITTKGIIQSCNSMTEKMFGYSEGELIGKNIKILMPEPYRSQHDGYLATHVRTGIKKEIWTGSRELIAQKKDGSTLPIYLSIGDIETEEGGRIFTGFIRDITEQKNSQIALEKLNQHLKEQSKSREQVVQINDLMKGANSLSRLSQDIIKSLCETFDAGQGCIYLYQTSYETQQGNSGFIETSHNLSLYGAYASKALEQYISFGEGIIGQCAEQKQLIQLDHIPHDYFKIGSALGNSEATSLLVAPLMYEDQLMGVVELATFQKFSETDKSTLSTILDNVANMINTLRILDRTKELLEDMKAQKEELRISNDDLEKSSQFKSEFLATMSHEIRTPMNGVLGMLDLLAHTGLSKEQDRKVGMAKHSALSLLRIINDILDFSKIEAGKLKLELIDFDLRSLYCDFAESMMARVRDKNLTIILDVTEIDQTKVKGDPSRLLQILNNLVSNAIKFTEHGSIAISARLTEINSEKLSLLCNVKDTGIGVAADKEQHLFEAFHQLDASTTRKYGGTGLGLSIVKQLCELMEGEIHYTRPIEGGSNFEFNITLERSPASNNITLSNNISNIQAMVVNSDEGNGQVLCKQLEKW